MGKLQVCDRFRFQQWISVVKLSNYCNGRAARGRERMQNYVLETLLCDAYDAFMTASWENAPYLLSVVSLTLQFTILHSVSNDGIGSRESGLCDGLFWRSVGVAFAFISVKWLSMPVGWGQKGLYK